jgi:hypothetical protein
MKARTNIIILLAVGFYPCWGATTATTSANGLTQLEASSTLGGEWWTGSVWEQFSMLRSIWKSTTVEIPAPWTSNGTSISRGGYSTSFVTGSSSIGQVGYSTNDGPSYSSFILNDGVFTEFNKTGMSNMKITGALGNIISGTYGTPVNDSTSGFIYFASSQPTTIPEPSSLSLLVLGGVLALLARRARNI